MPTTAGSAPTSAKLAAGWRVLRRHLRYALSDPRKLYWIARRIVGIVASGKLGAVLERHQVEGELYAGYPQWLDRHESAAAWARLAEQPLPADGPVISLLLPTYNSRPDLLRAAVDSVRRQLYPHWQLCIADDASSSIETQVLLTELEHTDARIRIVRRPQNGGIVAATNSALELATGDWVGFLDHDDRLAPDALLQVAWRSLAAPKLQFIYSDEDLVDEAGRRHRPHFKPDWDRFFLLGTNYILHFVVARTELVRSLGGCRAGFDGVQDWDLVLRLGEALRPDEIGHIPRVLYHWRVLAGSTAAGVYQKPEIVARQQRALTEALDRQGFAADAVPTGTGWRPQPRLPATPPKVSLVVPTRDRVDLLKRCIDSVFERSTYPAVEIVLVDNGSTDPATLAYYGELHGNPRIKRVDYPQPFNYAAQCNLGVAAATGDVVVLLNNDIEVISNDWLESLVGWASQPGVGLVGALLYYPDDTIQHAGVVLGLNGLADRPYLGYRRGHIGINGRLACVHQVSAMVTACAAIQRCHYLTVGGMNETLAVSLNDVDFSLRIRRQGLANLICPQAELYHHESASRNYENSPEDLARAKAEAETFLQQWGGDALHDPFYNPNLTLQGRAFALADLPRGAARLLPAGAAPHP